ncbi:PTS system, cellobiose-specific IIB component [Clostridium cavendishii DSM 21758]|uniref:PTS system, cellobiose-specific IIB component n=1 Tax=Clostridium cavendishii DSM 21758 TaxID=1121302 RepID=A0A1M6MH28_9CLOT|nr:PTS sugar transporter subunit IIB [Clostridium cavendishii]SHJ82755.1 PTS system, cellobiose-specific IIB component [Clostridium cavendishii DSM 21758]
MDEKNVLIVCGGGASSGFLAQNIRKAAKKRNVAINIKARSESEVDDYINDIDVLLFGPHLKYMEEELLSKGKAHNVPVAMIDNLIYGSLNGDKALELILELLIK